MEKRICYCCKEEKPLTEFVKDNRRKDRRGFLCLDCKRQKDKEYHQKLKSDPQKWEKVLERNRLEKQRHRDKILAYNREYNRRPEVIERKSEWSRKSMQNASLKRKMYSKFKAAEKRAKEKNLNFDLDVEYLLSIYTDTCPILEIPLNWNAGPRTDNTPALDKIIPEKGYIKGNVRFISTKANSMKTDATLDQLLLFAKNIEKYMKNEDIVRTTENNESVEQEDKEPLG